MDELQAQRWQRYGHDRLYVRTGEGEPVGWVDLSTDERHPEAPELTDTLELALLRYRAGAATPIPAPASPVPRAETPPPPPVTPSGPVAFLAADPPPPPSWKDLAAHRPGELARQRQQQEWEARKARSKFLAYLGRIMNIHTDERAWRLGALGEEYVGLLLERKLAKKGWRVLHSVPVGRGESDIDHVVIGPRGVFTVNTKNHPGANVWVVSHQIRVNGKPVPYLSNSLFEAQRASRLLSGAVGHPVEVRPVLAILTGGKDITFRSKPEEVLVTRAKWITFHLKNSRTRLTADEVERIYEAARKSTTWKI